MLSRYLRLFLLLLLLPLSPTLADEDDEIVTGCHFAAGEWGNAGIQICIRENQAARAEVRAYPPEVKEFVQRCSRRRDLGWLAVKRCIDNDIAAAPVLDSYAKEHPQLYQTCSQQFDNRGPARIKVCVDKALEAQGQGGSR